MPYWRNEGMGICRSIRPHFSQRVFCQWIVRCPGIFLQKPHVDKTRVCRNHNVLKWFLFDFIRRHLSIPCKEAGDKYLRILNIKIMKRSDATQKRSVHRKTIQTGQYLPLPNFSPMLYKQEFVIILLHGDRNMFLTGRRNFAKRRTWGRFIAFCTRTRPWNSPIQMAPIKMVFLM